MAKTAAFGAVHLVTSFSVGYGLTGSMVIAGAVSLVEPAVNTVVHFFFDKHWPDLERWWARRRNAPAVARSGSHAPHRPPAYGR